MTTPSSLPASFPADLFESLRREFRGLSKTRRAKTYVAVNYRTEVVTVEGVGSYVRFASIVGVSDNSAACERSLVGAVGPGCGVAVVLASTLA